MRLQGASDNDVLQKLKDSTLELVPPMDQVI